MVQLLHDLNLSFDTLTPVRLQQLVLLVDLDGYLLIQSLMKANPDNSVCSLANPLPDDVVVYIVNSAQLSAELLFKLLIVLVVLFHMVR